MRIVVALLLMAVGTWRTTSADIVTTANNQTFPNAHIDSVVAAASGVSFYLRGIKDNQVVGQPYPLVADQVTRIEFRSPWDTGQRPQGRPAAMVMLDGRRFEGVWVETFTRTGTEAAFQIRQAGIPAGGEAHPVPLAYMSSLAFTPMNLPGAELSEVPGLAAQEQVALDANGQPIAAGQPGTVPAQPVAPGVDPGVPAVIPGDIPPEGMIEPGMVPPGQPPAVQPTPPVGVPPEGMTAPMPGMPAGVPGEPGAMPGEPGAMPGMPAGSEPAAPRRSKEELAAAFAEEGDTSSDSSVAAATADDSWDFELDTGSSSTGSSGWGGGGRGMGVDIFGFFVPLPALVLGMTGTFVALGIMLFMSARAEDTKDFGIGKAIGTAALLAIVPPMAFYWVLNLLVFFIPWLFGMWLAISLAVMYFVARAIVMGMMEVLEEKANSILIWFAVFLVLGVYGSIKALDFLG